MESLIKILIFLLPIYCHGSSLVSKVNSWTNGPYIAFVGDSITEGYPEYQSVLDSGPSGDTNFNIAMWVFKTSGNIITATNYGYPARKLADCTNDLKSALSNHPKYIFLRSGVNDIGQTSSWSSAENALNVSKSLCVSSNSTLVVQDIMPYNNATDAKALMVRTWNTNLSGWCFSNSIWMIKDHDFFGTNRVSTGMIDNLKPEYNVDGIHITTNAYQFWSLVVYTNIMYIEGLWFTNRGTANTIRANTMRVFGP